MSQDDGSPGPGRTARGVERRRSGFFHMLLALLFLMFLMQTLWTRLLLGIPIGAYLTSLLLVGGTLAVSQHRVVAWLTGAVALAGLLSTHWPDAIALQRPIKDASLIGFCLLVSVTLLSDLFRRRRVDGGSLSAALCVYMLIGLGFSAAYDLADWTQPAAFDGLSTDGLALADTLPDIAWGGTHAAMPAGQHGPYEHPSAKDTRRALAFLYFSFVTLTTLGYGDIHPVAPFARTLAVLEALLGQIILVVLVARLVGLHVALAHSEQER
jgi:hypothetical protein